MASNDKNQQARRDESGRRGWGVGGRVVVAVAVLVVLMAVGLWWLMREDEPQKPGLRTPVVEGISGDGEKHRVTDARRGAAAETPREAVAQIKGEGEEQGVAAEKAPEIGKSEVGRQLTVDGEEIPEELLKPSVADRPEIRALAFSIVVSGVVRDGEGKAIADALVWADDRSEGISVATRSSQTGERYQYRVRLKSSQLATGLSTTSRADGSYELVVRGETQHSPESGSVNLEVALHAKAEGLLSSRSRVVSIHRKLEDGAIPSALADVDLTVSVRGSVAGRVTWQNNGEACVGASVALTRRDLGYEAFQGPRLGPQSQLGFTVPGAMPRILAGDKGEFGFGGIDDGEYLCWAVWPEMTHAKWRYRYSGVPNGPPQGALVIVRGGQAVTGLELALPRAVNVLFRTEPVLEVAPGISIAKSLDKSPMSDYVASAQKQWAPTRHNDGSFSVTGVLPIHRGMFVFAPGYLMAEREIVHHEGRDIDLGTIVLDLGGVIDGRVVDEAGRPVEGATVGCHNDQGAREIGRPRGSATLTTLTALDGTFRFSGLLSQRGQTLVAIKDGYHDGAGTIVPNPASAPAKIELVIHRATSAIVGRIEIAPGTPKAMGNAAPMSPSQSRGTGFVVAFDADSHLAKMFRTDQMGLSLSAEGGQLDIPVSSDWTFRKAVKPGKYKVVYTFGNESKAIDVEVLQGVEAEVVFRFGHLNGIKGKVLGTDGQPLGMATVNLHGPFRTSSEVALNGGPNMVAGTTASGMDGTFEFKDLKPGSYVLWLPDFPAQQHSPRSRGATSQRLSLMDGNVVETTIDLSKGPVGAMVTISVTIDGVAQTLQEPRLRSTRDGGSEQHPGFFVLPDGRWIATGMPAGTHSVAVGVRVMSPRPGMVNSTVKFEVPVGAKEVTINHDITVATFSGRVQVPRGVTVAFDAMRIMPTQITGPGGAYAGTGTPLIMVNDQGEFSHPNLAHGWYRIEVHAMGFESSSLEMEITKDTVLVLHLGPPTATIRLEYEGYVGDQTPEVAELLKSNASGMNIFVFDANGESALVTRPGQDYQVDVKVLLLTGVVDATYVKAGSMRVTVLHPMAEVFTAECFTVSGQTTTLKVKLVLGPRLTLTLAASDVPVGSPDVIPITLRREPNGGPMTRITLTKQADGSYNGIGWVQVPGTVYLHCTVANITADTNAVTIAAGTAATHAIRLVPK